MVKLADTQDLESCGAIRIGSNPFDGIRHTPPIRGRGFCVSTLSCTLAFSCEPAPLKNPFCRSSFPTFPSKLPQRKRRQRAPFAFLLPYFHPRPPQRKRRQHTFFPFLPPYSHPRPPVKQDSGQGLSRSIAFHRRRRFHFIGIFCFRRSILQQFLPDPHDFFSASGKRSSPFGTTERRGGQIVRPVFLSK